MPDYISRPGDYDLSLAAPYSQKGASARIFILNARHADLKATVDHYLNAAATVGTSYSPLGDRVIACFMAIREIRCAIPALGSMHEVDCAFFIPLIKWVGGVPKDVGFFPLYLFVNNSWAMVTGREVHGFRKDVALRFNDTRDVNDESQWNHDPADLRFIETWVMPTRSTGSRLVVKKLVEVQDPATPTADAWVVDALTDLVTAMLGSLGDLGTALEQIPTPGGMASWIEVVAAQVMEKIITTDAAGNRLLRLPIVMLRQFRDPTSSTKTDHRAIVEADMLAPISSISGTPLKGTFKLIFHDAASHPIASELGLPATAPSGLTVSAKLDFQLSHAK